MLNYFHFFMFYGGVQISIKNWKYTFSVFPNRTNCKSRSFFSSTNVSLANLIFYFSYDTYFIFNVKCFTLLILMDLWIRRNLCGILNDKYLNGWMCINMTSFPPMCGMFQLIPSLPFPMFSRENNGQVGRVTHYLSNVFYFWISRFIGYMHHVTSHRVHFIYKIRIKVLFSKLWRQKSSYRLKKKVHYSWFIRIRRFAIKG